MAAIAITKEELQVPLKHVGPVMFEGTAGQFVYGRRHAWDEWHVYKVVEKGLVIVSCHEREFEARTAARMCSSAGRFARTRALSDREVSKEDARYRKLSGFSDPT